MGRLISNIKKWIVNLSLKAKITLVITSVTLIAILIGFSILTFINIRNLKRDLVDQSFIFANLMSSYSSYGLIFNDKRSVDDDLKNLEKVNYITGVEIYNDKGKFFTSFKNNNQSKQKLIEKKAHYKFEDDELHVFQPVFSSENEFLGTIYLRVSLFFLEKNIQDYLLWILIIVLIVAVITVLIASFFQKIISQPILKLAGLTSRISETNDYTIRISSNSNDEIGILYDGFNKMLEEIVRNQKAMLKVQDELKDSEEQFSTFMKMLPAAAFIKDINSGYKYVNKFLNDDFSVDNWLGKSIDDGLTSHKNQFTSKYDKEALRDMQHYEDYLYNKNNELRYFETWKFPIQRKAKETLIGCIAIDTTQKKLIQNQINFYIKELEKNNKELEEFNYVASHDLREPLRTITSYCELLFEDIGPSINNLVKEDIKFITDATTRMNILIQDLLQLSRAGRMEYEQKNVDLELLISIVLKDLDLKIKETKAVIIYNNLPTVTGDATQLGRVFQNLITNSLKFKSEKDPKIIINAIDRYSHYDIIVEDNGIGIDKQYFTQIFSAFKRLHTRDEYEGTGIGLAICKKIIERHNGTIRIESEQGMGSKFIIQLVK